MKPIEPKQPPEDVSGGADGEQLSVEIFICPPTPLPTPLPYPQEPLTPVHFD